MLRFLDFSLDFLKNGLIRKLRLISRFMTSQTGKKIITIQVLPSISRSKDNQAMKIGHLIKLRENDFSEKSCKK